MHTSNSIGTWTTMVALLAPSPALAAEYYVAPDGSDAAPGTEADPFATAARGQQAASPGDTIYFRGGVYEFSGDSDIGVLFDKSGQAGSPINYFAYPGEVPVFDFNNLTPQARIRGFSVRADWLHFRGLELTGVQQILVDQNESWCIRVENGASNNIFELLNLHHNEGPGLFIQDGGNNLVLNVDSHHNYDPDRGGENADGFGCHTDDAGNVFRGCRAWYNSDDGFDFINSPGVCTVEGSWAFRNGFVPDSNSAAGNGAGIKAGGFTTNIPATIPRHVVRFNLTFSNRSQGFYANHHEGGIDWINNTAFNNPRNFDLLADEGRAEHYLKNNLAAGSGEALARATLDEIDDTVNSWSLGVTVNDSDFVSTSDSGADGPRQADGSLPYVGFMRLAEGSDLIDVGQDEGLPFAGEAPDLGAFEFGVESNTPSEPVDEGSGGQDGQGGSESGSGGTSEPETGTGGSGAGGSPIDIPPAGGEGGNTIDLPSGGSGGDGVISAPRPEPGPADDPPQATPGQSDPAPTQSSETPSPPPTSSTPGLAVDPAGAPENPDLSSGDDSDGCGCRVGKQRRVGGEWFMSLLALALLARRRRTTRS